MPSAAAGQGNWLLYSTSSTRIWARPPTPEESGRDSLRLSPVLLSWPLNGPNTRTPWGMSNLARKAARIPW